MSDVAVLEDHVGLTGRFSARKTLLRVSCPYTEMSLLGNFELGDMSMPDVLLLLGVVIFFSSVLRFVRAEYRQNR